MTNLYDSPVIDIKINEWPFRIHEKVIDKWLITGNVDKGFDDLHTYTSDGLTQSDAITIVNYMYTGSPMALQTFMDKTSIYIFVDKYFKDETVRDLFKCRTKTITSFNLLNGYLKTGKLSTNIPEEHYALIAKTVVNHIRKICGSISNARHWCLLDAHTPTKYESSEEHVTFNVININGFLKIFLEIAHEKGLNIWDQWKKEIGANDEELLYYGIILKDCPNYYQ